MRFLVAGGAGYIGSHMVQLLREKGAQVVVFDNLSTGHRHLAGDADFVQGDLLAPGAVLAVLREHGPFDAVFHFCARSLVGESMRDPALYYHNNVTGTWQLLEAMRATGHDRLVFSSTAAVYGEPRQARIDEAHPAAPINPYGRSKRMVEQLLADYAAAYGLRSVALRYFNAAGAHDNGRIGELHEPETHLIPNAIRAALGGPALQVFGTDYPTPDGSCVRDYVHVCDLADAHWLALDWLRAHAGAHCFNLGNGNGYSVLDVIRCVAQASGRAVPHVLAARRAGDPPVLVADASRARRELGWQPARPALEQIIASAWRFHAARA